MNGDTPELMERDELQVVRQTLEEGLREAQNSGADREDVAGLLEQYAEYVRDGYTCPPSDRGQWWMEVHRGDSEGGD